MGHQTLLDTVHPEDRDYVNRKWTAALKGEPYDIEHRIVVGDTVKWVRERAELEFDSRADSWAALERPRTLPSVNRPRRPCGRMKKDCGRRRRRTHVRLRMGPSRPMPSNVRQKPASSSVSNGDAARYDPGQDFFAKILAEDRATFIQIMQDLNPGADRYTADYRVVRADNGQVVWLEEITQALFDAQEGCNASMG